MKTDIKITSERENALLERREVDFVVSYEKTAPPRTEVTAKLAAKLNAKGDLVVVESMETQFGRRQLRGRARVYRDPRQLKALEYDYIFERGKPKAAEGEAEAPAPKVPAEKKE